MTEPSPFPHNDVYTWDCAYEEADETVFRVFGDCVPIPDPRSESLRLERPVERRLADRYSDGSGESAPELNPVLTFTRQHLRHVKPRIRCWRFLLKLRGVKASESDHCPVVPEILLLGFAVGL